MITPDQVPMWTHKAGHVLVWSEGTGDNTWWSMTLCGKMSTGHYKAVSEQPTRICRRCRKLLRDANLRPKG